MAFGVVVVDAPHDVSNTLKAVQFIVTDLDPEHPLQPVNEVERVHGANSQIRKLRPVVDRRRGHACQLGKAHNLESARQLASERVFE